MEALQLSKLTINPVLRKFYTTQSRYKVLYGGRGSSKSFNTALHAIFLASKYSLKFLCIRQFQNNIKESVYTLLKNIIYELELQDEFDILSNSIRHTTTGSEFVFYGIARNFMEIKSFEGADVLWAEEAHALTKEQWDVINPTIRNENSEIWIVFNPQNRTDFVFQRFIEHKHKDSIVQKINYDDNPYLSQTMQKVIAEAKEEDYEEYEYIYLGKVREGDERAVFSYDEVLTSMDNDLSEVDKTGVLSYGVDVARYGNYKSCATKRRGYHIYELKTYKGYSTMELANAISDMYHQESDKQPNAVFIDTIGVGAGVFDRIEEKGIRAIDSNVSMKADLTDIYQNKRAEMYFLLRDFIRKGGKIPNDEELKEELLAIRYLYSKTSGKIQIQAKDEMKELIGRSPDKADSVALHFFSEIRIEQNNMMEIQKRMFRRRR